MDLSQIHQVPLSRSRFVLTTVKGSTSWSTLSRHEAQERDSPIPLSVLLTRVTLPVVLLTFHRMLSFVRRTAELPMVSKYTRSRTATKSLSRSQSVSSADTSQRISEMRPVNLSYHATSLSATLMQRRSLTQALKGSRYAQFLSASQRSVYALSATA